MIDRRSLGSALLGGISAVVARPAFAKAASDTDFFATSVGARLSSFAIDARAGRLTPLAGSVNLPAEIQFAWQHPRLPILYVASSDANTTKQEQHHLSAVAINGDGTLVAIGAPVRLAARPIHLTVDHAGQHVLTAYNRPSSVTVHRIAPDGALGALVAQRETLSTGIYAHQVRVFPDDRAILLMTRGNDARAGVAEDPGALLVFDYKDGQLRNGQAVAPDGGRDFRPRHADFHPFAHILYVDLESQNVVQAYEHRGDRLSALPLFTAGTLAPNRPVKPGQLASAIRVHPTGRVLYVANRGTGTDMVDGQRVSNGGENSVAVFAIDRRTSAPRLIQSIDARGIHVRTMDVSTSGKWLVAASIAAAREMRGATAVEVPAGLSLFRIATDGRLTFASKYAIEAPGGSVFWTGALRL